ncbi:hypothetical protein CPC735_034090 [Coccidioides posadasii C735 delta SOWgp]|uniref:BTB domain-containing protein n=1 Tax=Coccidioides posadasii (strain C735) TaxID=222929 RepID=C5P5T3_COCP7|nr:hypothetical protein CPC735_034090 [Coccidioides posadasii C735 delta SOWgp]EER28073.1 hypothetical protein CPC735_034090 [Coccidioides posadasii C735 delta SOWgp]|eukprot:XP_003070218.1 hypothetical protein CPC735_034090 [Coccidioides posadasii C735 delta SOWgp]
MEVKYYEIDPDGDVLLLLRTAKQEDESSEDRESANDEPKAETPNERMETEKRETECSGDAKMYSPRDGRQLEVTEEDWKSGPFLILMNIIHGRTKKVPRTVTIDVLTEIASLVDYYECLEVVEIMAEIWTSKITIPHVTLKDIAQCIWLSYTFRWESKFKTWTKRAILTLEGPLYTQGLPIRDRILNEIQERREESIERIVAYLHGLLAEFTKTEPCCTECSCMMLGALTRALSMMHLLSPRPSRPFSRLNLRDMLDGLAKIYSPKWYLKYHGREAHKCSLESIIQPTLNSVTESITGLELENFVRPEPISRGSLRSSQTKD